MEAFPEAFLQVIRQVGNDVIPWTSANFFFGRVLVELKWVDAFFDILAVILTVNRRAVRVTTGGEDLEDKVLQNPHVITFLFDKIERTATDMLGREVVGQADIGGKDLLLESNLSRIKVDEIRILIVVKQDVAGIDVAEDNVVVVEKIH